MHILQQYHTNKSKVGVEHLKNLKWSTQQQLKKSWNFNPAITWLMFI